MDRAVDFSGLDEESLIHQVREGRHEAFSELVNRHSKRFYRVAYRVLFSKADAEDVVQEAFLKLWRRPGSWDDTRGTKFTTWFYKVVINLCRDHNRKKKPLSMDEDLQPADERDGQDVELIEKQKQALMDRCIRALPERQQLALTLCFYEGLSNREAAEIIGVGVKALQALIMRAKTTLRENVSRHVTGGAS